MKKLTLLLVFIISANSFSQTKNFIDLPYIETSAIADTLILPNRIHLNIIISEKDSKDKYSVEELENLMEQKLKEHKIVFDGRNLFDVQKMIELGYYYESIGRSVSEK